MTQWHETSKVKPLLAKETSLAGLIVVGEDIRFTLDEYTSAQTLTAENYLVLLNTSAGGITATVPAAVNHKNRLYIIKNVGTGKATLLPTGSDELEGEDSLELLEGGYVWLTSDADEWHIIGGRNVKLEELFEDKMREQNSLLEEIAQILKDIRLHQDLADDEVIRGAE